MYSYNILSIPKSLLYGNSQITAAIFGLNFVLEISVLLDCVIAFELIQRNLTFLHNQ